MIAWPPRILVATGNPRKLRELVEALASAMPAGGASPAWQSLADLPSAPAEPDENELTFAGNARLKAVYYSRAIGQWTLADDSGLEVDALGGRPGVLSARFAGSPAGTPRAVSDAANNRLLLDLLRGVPVERRTARFRCAVALADGQRIIAEADGAVEGVIVDEPRGSGGFGYDPYFFIPALNATTAELSAGEKHRISHRGHAIRALAERLRELAGR